MGEMVADAGWGGGIEEVFGKDVGLDAMALGEVGGEAGGWRRDRSPGRLMPVNPRSNP